MTEEKMIEALISYFESEVRREYPNAENVPSREHHEIKARGIVKTLMPTIGAVREAQYITIQEAPLHTEGLLWCERLPYSAVRGMVHAYDDGTKFGSSAEARGYDFTHFASLPAPPKEK